MNKFAIIAAIVASTASVSAEEISRGDIYLAGTEKKVLLFIQKNSIEKRGDKTILSNDFIYPNGKRTAFEEVTLRNGSIERYLIDMEETECGCKFEKKGREIKFSFTRGDNNNVGSEDYTSDIVTGPTFPEFVIQRWNDLASGKKVDFKMPVMNYQMLANFFLARNDSSPFAREGVLVLRMKISNIFLRLIIDHVDLVYDMKRKRILEVHGRSLLQRRVNDRLEHPVVDIYYTYFDEQK